MAENVNADRPGRRRGLFFAIVGAAVLMTVVAVGLLMNIFERKQEARNPFYRVVELTDETEDPAVWGKNFPLQYDDYKKTTDQVRTHFGGSEAFPHTPTKADPRSVVAQSKIEEDPRLKIMWAGYAFAKDFRDERGHAYMLDDQTYSERQQVVKQPGTCIQCHASVYVPYKKLGNGNLIAGFEKMNQMPFFEARKLVNHPVACADCHMPYKREGALKISDHHVRSPVLNINRACQTCHKWPEEELKARVEDIQQRTFALRNVAMDALMDLIKDLKAAKGAAKSDKELAAAQNFQRKAQFYLDFVEAENSTGFHAPRSE